MLPASSVLAGTSLDFGTGYSSDAAVLLVSSVLAGPAEGRGSASVLLMSSVLAGPAEGRASAVVQLVSLVLVLMPGICFCAAAIFTACWSG